MQRGERGGQRAHRPVAADDEPVLSKRAEAEEAGLVLRGRRPARDARGAVGAALRAHQARDLAPNVRRLRARLDTGAPRLALGRWRVGCELVVASTVVEHKARVRRERRQLGRIRELIALHAQLED
eukprot:scaffold58246_cov66-Phaeocystis_antarctica.AAC.1